MVTLSEHQGEALDAVVDWYNNDRKKAVFRLWGYAGSGKTTIAKYIAEALGCSVVYLTFTGKAALVLGSKGCQPSGTIHGAIYHAYEDDRGRVRFGLNAESYLRDVDLVIVDEAPMVGERLGEDLMKLAKRVLALGDPAQLPPVEDVSFFPHDNPDFLLTEIRRQELDNPIIRMSMLVRERKPLELGTWGDSAVLKRKRAYMPDMLQDYEQVLVGKNATRHFVNAEYRKVSGSFAANGYLPEQGERLICLRNDREKGFLNGMQFEVEQARMARQDVQATVRCLDWDTGEAEILTPLAYFEGQDSQLDWRIKKTVDEFCYAYGMTVHKAQGSQWESVLLFDESTVFKDDWWRWLYTGITRASDKVTVLV